MTLFAPLALLFLLSIPVVILLYLLKVRLREVEVSSSYLWERLLRDLAAQDPWQRPRFTRLMLIQVLLLTALALALARPAWSAIAREGHFQVVVLDASASMQATDVGPSRFGRAKQLAAATVAALPEGSNVAVIVAKNRPEVLLGATGARDEALAALEQASASGTALDLPAALRLATAIAASHPRARIDLFTDGAFEQPPALGEQSIATRWHTVGSPARNVAITAIAARLDPQNSRRYQVFVRLRNFTPEEASVTLGMYADGALVDSRGLALPALSSHEEILDRLPDDATLIQARIVEGDDLAIDDTAAVVLERRQPTRILLVSSGNIFLQRAIGLLPNVELFRATPARFDGLDVEPFDLVIMDGFLPASLPRQGVFLINPPDSPLLPVEGTLDQPRIGAWESANPLLRYVSWRDVRVQRAAKTSAPGWAKTLVEGDGHPLLLAGELEGRRLVALTFDLQESNLPLSAAFPILIANTVGYLEPASVLSARSVAAGAAVTIKPLPQAEELLVGRQDAAAELIPAGKPLRYDQTDQVGLYSVEQRARGEIISNERFAVNLVDEAESDISPRAAEPAALDGDQDVDRNVPEQRELWPWFVLAGLSLLIGEWWWYHRRA